MRYANQLIAAATTTLVLLLSACGTTTGLGHLNAARIGSHTATHSGAAQPASTLASEYFSSPLAAVVAASNAHNPQSIAQDREFIGAVLLLGGVYRYTVGQGKRGEDTVSVRVAIPRGAEIVAFWHTHGAAGHGRRYFSHIDTALVANWNKPFYMADHSGVLRVFHPGDAVMTAAKSRRLGLGGRAGYAKGTVVRADDGRRARIATHLLAQR